MSGVRKVIQKDIKWLLLIAGVVSVPLLTDYCLGGSDLGATLSQIRVIREGLGKAFPIRLGPLNSMDYGYSSASFQANVFYLIPALLHFFGMDPGSAYKWTLFLFNLATALIADVCFQKCSGRREIGLVSSMLYTWCPYRCSEMYLTGDLGELAAWTFLPLIALGIRFLYRKDGEGKDSGQAWVTLAWGFSLVTVSSTVVLSSVAVMTVVFMIVMWRETIQKERILAIGKTVVATVLVNVWFLLPMLLRMRNVYNVAPMMVQDFRGKGIYLSQYLTIFYWGGDGTDFVQNGISGAQAVGPGIAVMALLIFCFWVMFTKQYQAAKDPTSVYRWHLLRKAMLVGSVLMILSSNLFPWDLAKDRNLLCSVILALLYTPAKLGISTGLCLILSVCLFLAILADNLKEETYKILLLAVVSVSFGTTQFLLGNILTSRYFFRETELAELGGLPFALLTQESPIWRFSEAVSLATIGACVVMCVVRRLRSVKKV